jgi:hypothetical protein
MAAKRNQAHRSGQWSRGPRSTRTSSSSSRKAPTPFLKTDTWRALRIMGEFVEGFDALAGVGRR